MQHSACVRLRGIVSPAAFAVRVSNTLRTAAVGDGVLHRETQKGSTHEHIQEQQRPASASEGFARFIAPRLPASSLALSPPKEPSLSSSTSQVLPLYERPIRIALAVSGGADSTAMAALAFDAMLMQQRHGSFLKLLATPGEQLHRNGDANKNRGGNGLKSEERRMMFECLLCGSVVSAVSVGSRPPRCCGIPFEVVAVLIVDHSMRSDLSRADAVLTAQRLRNMWVKKRAIADAGADLTTDAPNSRQASVRTNSGCCTSSLPNSVTGNSASTISRKLQLDRQENVDRQVIEPPAVRIIDLSEFIRIAGAADLDAMRNYEQWLALDGDKLKPPRKQPLLRSHANLRQARYAALWRASTLLEADVLLTGHHAGDRVETFLQRYVRGSGPVGLSSILASQHMIASALPVPTVGGTKKNGGMASSLHVRSVPRTACLTICRPLLDIWPERLRDTCRAQDLEWIEDPGNESYAAFRTHVRRAVRQMVANDFSSSASEQKISVDMNTKSLAIASGPNNAFDKSSPAIDDVLYLANYFEQHRRGAHDRAMAHLDQCQLRVDEQFGIIEVLKPEKLVSASADDQLAMIAFLASIASGRFPVRTRLWDDLAKAWLRTIQDAERMPSMLYRGSVFSVNTAGAIRVSRVQQRGLETPVALPVDPLDRALFWDCRWRITVRFCHDNSSVIRSFKHEDFDCLGKQDRTSLKTVSALARNTIPVVADRTSNKVVSIPSLNFDRQCLVSAKFELPLRVSVSTSRSR